MIGSFKLKKEKEKLAMKKTLYISIILLTGHVTFTNNNNGIVLQSTALKSLDGICPAFDGETILNIVDLITKYMDMNLGKIDPKTKERIGIYSFRGKKCCVARLAEIEKEYAHDEQAKVELQVVLEEVKNNFIKLNEKFIKQIQGFKELVISIMRESCNKRNIAHSFMLSWADTQAGQETESFKVNMKNFT